MTKKDYILIAKAIHNAHENRVQPLKEGEARIYNIGVKNVANELAYLLKQANSAFRKDTFLKACGFED